MGRRPLATRHTPPATRAGLTLAEVVVALVLLAWGALALVAASGAAIRAISAAELQTVAVGTARGRVEVLAASRCSSLRDGSAVDSARGLRERWTVTVLPNGARRLTGSVEYLERGAWRHVVIHRLVVC